MLPQEPYKRFAVITMYVFVAIAALFLIFRYLWGAILPFIIAYLFAECFKPIVKYSEKNRKFPKKSFVLFVILLAAGAISALLYCLTRQVIREISELAMRIGDAVAMIRTDDGYAEHVIDRINSFVPFVDVKDRLWEMRSNLDEELWGLLMGIGDKMSGRLVTFLGSAAAFLPKALFAFIVVILSTYYIAIDRVKVNCFFLSLFPKDLRPKLTQAKELIASSVGLYLRAYGMLFLITFSELLAAFFILGVDYAFVLALVIALVDILPVLGTGTVLIPWGAVALFAGNYGRGIGILVTYAVITVVRQIIEPRIVGKFIGLSPLASLASMYIGLKLMGIVGIFVLPLASIFVKRLLESRDGRQET